MKTPRLEGLISLKDYLLLFAKGGEKAEIALKKDAFKKAGLAKCFLPCKRLALKKAGLEKGFWPCKRLALKKACLEKNLP